MSETEYQRVLDSDKQGRVKQLREGGWEWTSRWARCVVSLSLLFWFFYFGSVRRSVMYMFWSTFCNTPVCIAAKMQVSAPIFRALCEVCKG